MGQAATKSFEEYAKEGEQVPEQSTTTTPNPCAEVQVNTEPSKDEEKVAGI
jgi:hypothetical protein